MPKTKRSDGYQLCVHVGPSPVGIPDVARRVELTINDCTVEGVVSAIRAAGLSAADFRTEVVTSFEGDRDTALLAYVGLVSFAQRRLDAVSGGRIVNARDVDALARGVVDNGKPDPIPYHVQVGAPHGDLPSILFSSQLSAQDASAIRYARRVRLAPADDIAAAITQFLVVAGIRARGDIDRFPYLVRGDEPAGDVEAGAPSVVGICLDTLRAGAVGLRREHRSGDRKAVVPREELSRRQAYLLEAAAVPIEEAMLLLGGRMNLESGLWHCPRPERHNNGDANASMRCIKGLVRCYRCDGERVDSLRLTMDVTGLSPDEAARWLLAEREREAAQSLEGLFA